MEVQNNDLSWANQVDELNKSQGFLLSYTTPNVEEINTHNEATAPNNMPNPHGEDVNNCSMNTCTPQGLEMSFIPYKNKQLVLSKIQSAGYRSYDTCLSFSVSSYP